MSEALYKIGGLRFWEENEILLREHTVQRIVLTLRNALQELNSAWVFKRIEGSLITPLEYINQTYDETDVFYLKKEGLGLRPETTISSYLYAKKLLLEGKAKPPLCVWQHGKSFRVESNDGARASELRFNEFYQLEFQCLFKDNTKADYSVVAIPAIKNVITQITGKETRIVDSDRLPSYSTKTVDIEVFWDNKWKEVCSISFRKDFLIENYRVLEIAIGTDRLISIIG